MVAQVIFYGSCLISLNSDYLHICLWIYTTGTFCLATKCSELFMNKCNQIREQHFMIIFQFQTWIVKFLLGCSTTQHFWRESFENVMRKAVKSWKQWYWSIVCYTMVLPTTVGDKRTISFKGNEASYSVERGLDCVLVKVHRYFRTEIIWLEWIVEFCVVCANNLIMYTSRSSAEKYESITRWKYVSWLVNPY